MTNFSGRKIGIAFFENEIGMQFFDTNLGSNFSSKNVIQLDEIHKYQCMHSKNHFRTLRISKAMKRKSEYRTLKLHIKKGVKGWSFQVPTVLIKKILCFLKVHDFSIPRIRLFSNPGPPYPATSQHLFHLSVKQERR